MAVCRVMVQCVGIFAFLFSLIWFGADESIVKTDGWPRVLLFGIPSLLVVYAAARAEISGKVCFPKSMIKIGDASYSIYLSHVLVLAALGRIWAKMTITGVMINIAMLVVMTLATISVGLLSYRWMETPILNRFRKWRT